MMRISAVVPAFNEAAGIREFLRDLLAELNSIGEAEAIVVDDGSTDTTWQALLEAARESPQVTGIRLTRNFGKEVAILAGLRASSGGLVVVLDADGQHPVHLISKMYEVYCATGVPVVEAVKAQRQEEGAVRGALSRAFYRIFAGATGISLKGATDFKLMERRVVETYLAMPERRRFFRALTRWMGYPIGTVPFVPPPRRHGASRWSAGRLVSLAWSSLKAFSIAPLRIVTFLGLLTLAATGVLGAHTMLQWLRGEAAAGFPTVILLQLGIGSVLMISVGLVGEYLGQVYEEVKARPPYVVREVTTTQAARPGDGSSDDVSD